MLRVIAFEASVPSFPGGVRTVPVVRKLLPDPFGFENVPHATYARNHSLSILLPLTPAPRAWTATYQQITIDRHCISVCVLFFSPSAGRSHGPFTLWRARTSKNTDLTKSSLNRTERMSERERKKKPHKPSKRQTCVIFLYEIFERTKQIAVFIVLLCEAHVKHTHTRAHTRAHTPIVCALVHILGAVAAAEIKETPPMPTGRDELLHRIGVHIESCEHRRRRSMLFSYKRRLNDLAFHFLFPKRIVFASPTNATALPCSARAWLGWRGSSCRILSSSNK